MSNELNEENKNGQPERTQFNMQFNIETIKDNQAVALGTGATATVNNIIQNIVNNTTLGSDEKICPKPRLPPLHFGGRASELAALRENLLHEKMSGITALHGMGGIGKTTLALKVAYDLFESGTFRAVLWADFTPHPDLFTMLTRLGQSVDPLFFAGDTPIEQLIPRVKNLLETVIAEKCTHCRSPRTLVVFDDVWPNGLAVARRLQEVCPPQTTFLITSRSREVVIDLGVPRGGLILERFSVSDGVAMLVEQLPPEYEVKLLAELVEILGGHPLALSLAARRALKADNPKILRKQIAQYQVGLASGSGFRGLELDKGGEQREDNLGLVLSYSYMDLSSSEQRCFRSLGVLAANVSFDQAMLQMLWEMEQPEAEQIINRLCLASLLKREQQISGMNEEEEGENNWYSQHTLLRAYALELLHKEGEYKDVYLRYETYIIFITQTFDILPPELWNLLTPYLVHIHVVGDNLITQLSHYPDNLDVNKRVLAFAKPAATYLFRRREVHQQKWLFMGLAASRNLHDRRNEGMFLNSLGNVYKDLGDQGQALEFFQQALTLMEEIDDKDAKAIILMHIGIFHKDLGANTKALEFYQQALPLLEEVGDKNGKATTLGNIGIVYADLGDKNRALTFYQQALTLLEEVNDEDGKATTLLNIGKAYSDLGDYNRALHFYQQALPIYTEVGDMGGKANTLGNIGIVYSALGDKNRALYFYQLALPIYEEVEDKSGKATTLMNIGNAYSALRNKKRALDYYQQSLTITEEIGDKGGKAITLGNIGNVYADLKDNNQALHFYKQALILMEEVGDKGAKANTLGNIGIIYADLGDNQRALDFYQQAVPLLEEVGDKNGKANTLGNIGNVYAELGDNTHALDFYQQALMLMEEVDDIWGEVRMLYNIAMIYSDEGDNSLGLEYLEQALMLEEEINHPDLEADHATLERLRAKDNDNEGGVDFQGGE